jgi:phosphohistidine phosphatase
MKTLVIIRHAKSSWDYPTLSDFERPLNDRGLRDAPRMGKRLDEKEIIPDLMLSSPAKRALTTCHYFADALQCPSTCIRTESSLYHASEETILKIIKSLENTSDIIFLFGHNPGLTDFVNKISNSHIQNIPTCGMAGISFNALRWREITWGSGELIFFDFPKNKV